MTASTTKPLLRRLVGVVAVLAVVAAACSGTESNSDGVATLEGPSTTVNSEGAPAAQDDPDTEAAFLGLAQCLRDEGIDVADPTVDADGNVDLRGMFEAAESLGQDEIEQAAAACSEYIEDVVPTFSDFDFTQLQDDLLEFAGCMRDNGYDLPDPDFSNFVVPGDGGGNAGPFGSIDTDDPGFEQALQACQDILAGFIGPGSARGNP